MSRRPCAATALHLRPSSAELPAHTLLPSASPAPKRRPLPPHTPAGGQHPQQRQQRRGVFIQTQPTPNPLSLMFVPGRPVVEGGGTLSFGGAREAMASPLAKRLFQIDGITKVAGCRGVGRRCPPVYVCVPFTFFTDLAAVPSACTAASLPPLPVLPQPPGRPLIGLAAGASPPPRPPPLQVFFGSDFVTVTKSEVGAWRAPRRQGWLPCGMLELPPGGSHVQPCPRCTPLAPTNSACVCLGLPLPQDSHQPTPASRVCVSASLPPQDYTWAVLKPDVFAAIMDHYSSGEPLLYDAQEVGAGRGV